MCADWVYFEMSDDRVYYQLVGSERDFYRWNATSVGNLFVACSGFNGYAVRFLAIRLLKKCLKWYKYRDRINNPSWLWCAKSPKIALLPKILDYVKNNEICGGRDHEALRIYLEGSGVYDKIHVVF